MSCVLRISGEHLDVDDLLNNIDLEPSTVFRKGEVRRRMRGDDINQKSGFNLGITRDEFDGFHTEISHVIDFFEQNQSTLQTIASTQRLETMQLDFLIFKEESFLSDMTFPSKLIKHISRYPIELVVSILWEPELKRENCEIEDAAG